MAESDPAGIDTARPAEVAEALDTTEAGLAQMRHRGAGPKFVKVGTGHRGRVLYRWSHVREFLDANTVAPKGPGAGAA